MPPPPASQKEPLPPQDQRHPPQQAQLRVLTGVHGTDKVYCLPAVGAATATVVFFVGDQLEAKGLPPRVLQLQDPKQQAALMAAKFPGANVAVVMPSRLEACFACFDHFLGRVTATGEPLGHDGQSLKAVSQLASLLRDGGLWAAPPPRPPVPAFSSAPASLQLPDTADRAADGKGGGSTDGGGGGGSAASGSKAGAGGGASVQGVTGGGSAAAGGGGGGPAGRVLPVTLIGFSKGGTVLNQVLAELAAWAESQGGSATGRRLAAGPPKLDPSSEVRALLGAVAELHYADVGLNCRGAYITDPQVAQSLGAAARRPPRIFLHGTPRQWDDPTRPWIGREAARFAELLKAEGVTVTTRKYFVGEPLSLEMHFEAIEAMQVDDAAG